MSVIFHRSAAPTFWGYELPREIAYLHKNHSCEEWKPVYFKDIIAKKTEHIMWQTERKRMVPTKRAAFIWVFENDSWLLGGWWIYIKTLGPDFGINFRHESNHKLVEKIMELVPLKVDAKMEFFDKWAARFAFKYRHVGFHRRRQQGLLKCWALLDECGRLKDIELCS